MSFASAVVLRRLVAALRSLGLNCALPVGGQDSRMEFILTTLLQLQYLIEPPQFASEREGGEGQPELPPGEDASLASDPWERAAMSARVGVALELQVLFRAEADAVYELLRLAETLADATRQALRAAAAIPASSNSSRALLGEQLHRSRQGLLDLERSNEALASQVQELKEKIRGAEQNADRLNKQLLLLGRPQNSALAAAEEQQQREMQEQLRQLYIQYARRSAVCDTLTASVEAIAGRAEAAAAQNRLRLQEARQQLQLEQSAAASATDTQTNCMDTLCGGMSEEMGLTLASSEQLCTEGSELDLAGL
ncbi:uncharacterized protein EMH_0029270 [Eimeria mitis]|uniref:Uncharacterized protein n=1 Tax=Eimeria mitis TaxID=44415 RepID=U6JQK9_9EIME|nr:uncharacterized protein EMH_0029270 [Eimeria mitis]CDJ27141.1 hypothetical protein EMH_0029270 [Eimeria mitis]